MGRIFELIADEALKKLDDGYRECHVCEAGGVDLYAYQGVLYDESGNKVDDDIYAVCAQCILAGRVAHARDFEYIRTINNYLVETKLTADEREVLRAGLIAKYQRTPDIPIFMQYEDRPLCCRDITEFTGHPHNDAELYQMAETYCYWEKGVVPKHESVDFKKYGRPESYRDVAGFCCRHCGQKYFTFQFT